MSRIEGARPEGSLLTPGPRWRSVHTLKKPALGHGYEARATCEDQRIGLGFTDRRLSPLCSKLCLRAELVMRHGG